MHDERVILQISDGIYSTSSHNSVSGLREQQNLLTLKFKRQSQNMIKFLQSRIRYLEYVHHIVKGSSVLPSFCPIELIRDGNMFAEIMENYCDSYLTSGGGATVKKFIPLDVLCLKDRELLLRLISVYNAMFEIGSEELRRDKEIIRAMLTSKFETIYALEYLPDDLKSNTEIILEFVESNHIYLSGVDVDLMISEDFMSKAVQKSIYSINYADSLLLENKEWFHKVIEENLHVYLALTQREDFLEGALEDPYPNLIFKDLPFEIRNDKKKMLQSLKENGLVLEYVSEHLQQDREIAMCAVTSDGMSLQFVIDDFRKDKDIIEKAFISNWESFQFAHESLKEDSDFVLKLAKIEFDVLRLASLKLQSDPKFCLRYLSVTSLLLRKILTICHELNSNREFIMNALDIICKKDPNSCVFVDLLNEGLLNDKELIMKCLIADIENYEYIAPHLKQDKEILLLTAQKCTMYIEVPEFIKQDREFIATLFSNTRFKVSWLDNIPQHFLEDDQHLLDILLNNQPSCIEYFPVEKQQELFRKYPLCLVYMSNEIQLENVDLLIEIVRQHPKYFDYLENEIQQAIFEKDKQVITNICKEQMYLIQHLDNKLRSNHEIALASINTFETAFQYTYIPYQLQQDWDFSLRAVKSCGLVLQYLEREDEILEIEALKQCGYFPIESIGDMKVTDFKHLYAKRMELGYSSDFFIPQYFTTFDFL